MKANRMDKMDRELQKQTKMDENGANIQNGHEICRSGKLKIDLIETNMNQIQCQQNELKIDTTQLTNRNKWIRNRQNGQKQTKMGIR